MIYRNNADLGKGVPRQHVFHEAWELLFFFFFRIPCESPAPALCRSALLNIHLCIQLTVDRHLRPDWHVRPVNLPRERSMHLPAQML
jgi:hypothetical protein